MEDKLEVMRRWVAQLNEAADAYYNGRGELMTDFEWDALFDKVKALEAETGIVLSDSPTNKVSADDLAGQKEAHEFAALSLAKTKSVAEVAKWAEGRPIWLSWKLDGLTLVVTYDDGRLAKVVTRGDGHVGTNITYLAAGIRGIPKTVKAKGHLVVRGEAVISYADFEAFVAGSDEEYANPRNLASGSLTLKDVDELKPRNLQWIPFTLVHADAEIVSWGARMDYLQEIGLNAVERERLDAPDVATLQAAIDRWTEKVTGKVNPFPVDGLVVCYDDTEYAQTGSVTGHHATRAGFAFKWQDESAETTLRHIEWSCAASVITPVAVFDPVRLEGTAVSRASLCNISELDRLGIGVRQRRGQRGGRRPNRNRDQARMTHQFELGIAQRLKQLLVRHRGGRVVGPILLEDLLVLPQYRRRGVGTYVLDDCKAKADGMLYRYVYIGNHAETAFYEKNGFTVSSLASPTREVLAWNPYGKKRR